MVNLVNYSFDKKSISAEVYEPNHPIAAGAVVIAYGADGLTDDLSGPWATMIRGYAEALANKGHFAIIPSYLSATGTTPGKPVIDSLAQNRDQWQAAIAAAIDYLLGLPAVDPARIGLLGFSLGGHLCLRLRQRVKVLVEYFAPLGDGIGLPGTLLSAQIHHGKADCFPGTDFRNAELIEATLKGEHTAVELFEYSGAGHGFIGTDPDNTGARVLSMTRTLKFFEEKL